MLHTLTCSPWYCNMDTLLWMLCDNDDLLLLQDGVLAAIKSSCFAKKLRCAPVMIFALKSDVEARGLVDKISPKVAIISYTGFVDLVVKQGSQMSW